MTQDSNPLRKLRKETWEEIAFLSTGRIPVVDYRKKRSEITVQQADIPAPKTFRQRNNEAVNRYRQRFDKETRRAMDRAYQSMRRLESRETSARRESEPDFIPVNDHGSWPSDTAAMHDEAFHRIVKGRTAIGLGDESAARQEAETVRQMLAEDESRDGQRLASHAREILRDVGGNFDQVDALCSRTCFDSYDERDHAGAAFALITRANLVRMQPRHEDGDLERALGYLKKAEDLIVGLSRRKRRDMMKVLLHQIALLRARICLYNFQNPDAAAPFMQQMRDLAGEPKSPTWMDTVRDDAGFWIVKGNADKAQECMESFRAASQGATVSRHSAIAAGRAEVELARVTGGDVDEAFGNYVSLIEKCPSAHHLNQLVGVAAKTRSKIPPHLRALRTGPFVPALAYVYQDPSVIGRL